MATEYTPNLNLEKTPRYLHVRGRISNANLDILDEVIGDLQSTTVDAMRFKGVINASANPNYPAAEAGDVYRVSVAGKIGGASGTTVEVGDLVIAIADNAGGTQAAVGSSWSIEQANINTADFVSKSTYDAHSVLVAQADDSPLALTMGASTILARLASGDIVAAAVDEVRALLGIMDPSLLTSGQETLPRFQAASSITQTTQVMRLSYFTARKSETINNVRISSLVGYTGGTPTLVRVGVYSVAGNGDLTLVASTANDTALLAANQTNYTKALQAGVALVAGTRYAVGVLVVTAGTAPTVPGGIAAAGPEAAQAPRVSATVTGQSDLPSSVSAASLTNSSNAPYVALIP